MNGIICKVLGSVARVSRSKALRVYTCAALACLVMCSPALAGFALPATGINTDDYVNATATDFGTKLATVLGWTFAFMIIGLIIMSFLKWFGGAKKKA